MEVWITPRINYSVGRQSTRVYNALGANRLEYRDTSQFNSIYCQPYLSLNSVSILGSSLFSRSVSALPQRSYQQRSS